jgi:hypothetical protein
VSADVDTKFVDKSVLNILTQQGRFVVNRLVPKPIAVCTGKITPGDEFN